VPAVVGRAYEHTLVIHCGVRFTVFDGRDWVADPPIDDGSGNPPPGWTGAGTMVLLRPDRARFTSVDGDVAEFRPRAPGEPPFFCA